MKQSAGSDDFLNFFDLAFGKTGTLESGAVRFSPGPFTTQDDVDDACALVERLTR